MKTMLAVVLTGVLLCAALAVEGVGKVTVDPNVLRDPTRSAVEDNVALSLSTPVTYDSGSKRLHTVLGDLSRMTGIRVYCGRNRKDWQVRDIPIVACVKDMPLAKLLRAIADATHTSVRKQRVGDDAAWTYRIYRTPADQAAFDSYFQNRYDARWAAAEWHWDAMVACGKSQEPIDLPPFSRRDLLISKLIASLGPDAKSDLFSGDTFVFRGNDPAYQAIMRELYLLERNGRRSPAYDAAPPPTDEDTEAAVLKIKLRDTGGARAAYIQTNLSPLVWGSMFVSSLGSLSVARFLENSGLSLPPYPEVKTSRTKTSMDIPDMVRLFNSGRGSVRDYPFMRVEVDLVQPQNLETPKFSDIVRAVALAGECNIVTEDFTSHKTPEYQDVRTLLRTFRTDTTISEALSALRFAASRRYTGYTWFADEDDRLIVGWADDDQGFRTWQDHHRNLLPQEYLDGLKNKLRGSGLELDDVIQFTEIPKGSFDEWIEQSCDLSELSGASVGDEPEWRLYNALQPGDKLLASSERGLPLWKFDIKWVADFFRACRIQQPLLGELPRQLVNSSVQAKTLEMRDQRERNIRATSDPEVISTMVMRIVKRPATIRWVPGRGFVKVPRALKLSRYDMVIDYSMDGACGKLNIAGPPLAFPMVSEARN